MAEDYRKTYVLTTAANYFSRKPDDFLKFLNEKHLTRFLDDLNTIILVVNVARDISFSNKVRIFYKSHILFSFNQFTQL